MEAIPEYRDTEDSVNENMQMTEIFIREPRVSLKRCDSEQYSIAEKPLPNKRPKSTPKKKPKKEVGSTSVRQRKTPEKVIEPVNLLLKVDEPHLTERVSLTPPQEAQVEEQIKIQEPVHVERTNALLADILENVLTEEEKAEFYEPSLESALEQPFADLSTSFSLHTDNSSSNLNDSRINLVSFLEPKPEYSFGTVANDIQLPQNILNDNVSLPLTSTSNAVINGSVEGFACAECNTVCKSKPSLRDHMRGHKKRFKCPLCEKEFRRKTDMLDHCNNHSGDKPYTCPGCLETFTTKYRLKSHVVKHHKELQQYTCTICEKSFTILQYQIHIKSHVRRCETCCETHLSHGMHQTTCRLYIAPPVEETQGEDTSSQPTVDTLPIADDKEEDILPDVAPTVKPEIVHSCLICGQTFAEKEELDSHTEMHMNGSEFVCDLCGESFNDESELCSHTCAALHTAPAICDEVTPEWDSLMAPHAQEVELKCQMCKEEFEVESEFHTHVCNSPDIRQLHCLESLSTGCEIISGDEIGMLPISNANNICLNCQRCNRTFNTYIELYSHVCVLSVDDYNEKYSKAISVAPQVISETDGFPFNCHMCNVTISTSSELSSHDCSSLETNHLAAIKKEIDVPNTEVESEFEDFTMASNFNHSLITPDLKASTIISDFKDDTTKSDFEEIQSDTNLHTKNTELKCRKCQGSFLTELQLNCHICVLKSAKIEIDFSIHDDCSTDAKIDSTSNQSQLRCHVCNTTYETEKEFYSHVCSEPTKPKSESESGHSHSCLNDCSMCDEMFFTINDYSSHMSTHLEGTGLLCTICSKQDVSKSFSTKQELIQHILLFHYYTNEYKCYACDEQFTLKSAYQHHLEIHDGVELPKCSVCQEAFLTKLHCDCHTVLHSVGVHFMCSVCSSTFAHESDFNRHLSIHPKLIKYTCSTCSTKFRSESELTIHTLSKCMHNMKCEICDKTFTSSDQFRLHRSAHFAYKCSLCSEVISTREELGVHARTHYVDVASLMCRFCRKIFPNEDELNTHIATHMVAKSAPVPKIKCALCDERFLTISERNCHRKAHDVSAPLFKCALCDQMFSTVKERNLHKKTHNVVAPTFTCNFCLKKFFTSDELDAHAKIHSATALKCNFCDETFSTVMERIAHLKSHKNHTCQVCKKEFSTNKQLVVHNRKLHACPAPKFKCPRCKLAFLLEEDFSTHMSMHQMSSSTFKCVSCNTDFATERQHNRHPCFGPFPQPPTKLSSNTRPLFSCRFCLKVYDNYAKIRSHLHHVHNEKVDEPGKNSPASGIKFGCIKCKKLFSTPYLLKRHYRTTWSKCGRFFSCKLCVKSFHTLTRLNKHQHIHNRKSVCRICKETFDTRFEMEEHSRVVHFPPSRSPSPPTAKFTCATCGEQFTSEFLQDQHVMTHHNVQFQCKHCDKKFDGRTELDKHMSDSHSKPTILYRRVSVLSTIKDASGKANYVKMKK